MLRAILERIEDKVQSLMGTPIQHIVFDIGNVLVHYDPALAYERLIQDEAVRRAFFNDICNAAWTLEQDRGRSWENGEAVLIEKHPDKEHLIRAFRKNWLQMVPHQHEEAVQTMRQLIQSHKDVTLLTNFAADTFAEASDRFPFFHETRGVTVSGQIGLVKPEIEIFQHHERTFDLDRRATLFIDDNAANISAARAFGWQTIGHTPGAPIAPALSSFDIS